MTITNIKREFFIKLNVSNLNDKKIDQYLQKVKSQFPEDLNNKVTVVPILCGESSIGIIIYKMAGDSVISQIYNVVI